MKLNDFIKNILPHCNTYPNVLRIIVSDYNTIYDFSNEVEFYGQISSEINEFSIKEVLSAYDEMEIKHIWQDNEGYMYIVV